MLPVNRNPSPSELRWFGILLVVFTAGVGALVGWRTGEPAWRTGIWIGGGTLALVFFAVPAARRSIYLGWMYAAFPIGWTVSHVLLALIYFGVVTPVALVMRALGHDALERKLDRSASTYWVRTTPQRGPERYFKQF
jgi:TRAP-type C4-dicarboxylate transport system permease small subunit